ncbi:alpha/beta hydrolase [Arenicella chitinivorans]|uniref:Palmitoyl-protein thioesterase ABHD10, mitochondrial n=1 Tax=Arenicella chitinivorans TaxID=1329800 RepID=A0A918RKV6_9GAMM|nr:alpha/beta hydrolase [Arenicella chitinivorans]GHA00409.1 alpha/beta hydrolase [Arenicella chitinivorans]
MIQPISLKLYSHEMSTQLPIHLAHDYAPGNGPVILFCGGFNSNRNGNKAVALQDWALENHTAYVRFDYQGHGDSPGDFADCTVSTWLNDILTIIDALSDTSGVLLVGSSMGGWLSLLAARLRPKRVAGLLLIACAADMTDYYPARLAGFPRQLDPHGRQYYAVPNEYDNHEPYRIYQSLLEDGAQYTLLDSTISILAPVRLIHGIDDDVVPWQRSEAVLQRLETQYCSLSLVKHGDHRLSKPHELRFIQTQLAELLRECHD